MGRLEFRLLLWSMFLTAVFGAVFLEVARLDPLSVRQLYELRLQVRQAEKAYGLPEGPPPVLDWGRANLPPYIGRGRSEMVLWILLLAGLGAVGAWGVARPIERPLRQLADSCRALQMGADWTSPPLRGPLQAVGRDFSVMLASLREQEKLLEEAAEAARQALALRETLLGRSYGEFRQPLLDMRHSLRGLEPHPYVQTLERNLDLLLQLVDDLAQQPLHPQFEEVELGDFVRVALAGSERVEVIDGEPVTVSLDPLRTRQALLNLVGNALKFSRAPVKVDWGRHWIRVEDRGSGFENEKIPEMLQAFRQLEPGEGVGLGLATAQRWMNLQGGRLELESRPGQGTRARLLFATSDSSSSPEPPADAWPV